MATFCEAHKAAQLPSGAPVTAYPGKAAAVSKKLANAVACVVAITAKSDSQKPASPLILLVKRPEKGLLAGMWEVPTAELAQALPDLQSKVALAGSACRDCASANGVD